GVVEDVLVDEGAGLQHLGVAGEQPEVVVLRASRIDEAVVVALGQLRLGEGLEVRDPPDLAAGERVRVRGVVVPEHALFGGHAASSSGVSVTDSDVSPAAASTRSPVTTRCWKARNDTSCDSVTMPSADQPASTRRPRSAPEASRGRNTRRCVCARAAARRSPTAAMTVSDGT